MEFSAIVLMEKEKDTNIFIRELGSYEVDKGAEYLTKLFYNGEKVFLYFDTNKEVENWEFTAIYDLFNEDAFQGIVTSIEPYDEEYNPTWIVTFDYDEDHKKFNDRLKNICRVIDNTIIKAFNDIEGRIEDYK